MRFILISSTIVLFFILIHNTISAHEISTDAWIYVNDEDLVIPNPNPETSKLESAEHLINKNFKIGDELEINLVEGKFGFSFEDKVFKWFFADKVYETQDLKIKLDKTGSYFLKYEIFDGKSMQLMSSDNILLNVGDNIPAPEFSINDQKISVSKTAEDSSMKIKRAQDVELKVLNASSLYKYQWDFGDGLVSEDLVVSHNFSNAKLPTYVILRKTDLSTEIFSENYIRLITDEEPTYKVVKPMVIAPEDKEQKSKYIIVSFASFLGLWIVLVVLKLGMGKFIIKK